MCDSVSLYCLPISSYNASDTIVGPDVDKSNRYLFFPQTQEGEEGIVNRALEVSLEESVGSQTRMASRNMAAKVATELLHHLS